MDSLANGDIYKIELLLIIIIIIIIIIIKYYNIIFNVYNDLRVDKFSIGDISDI